MFLSHIDLSLSLPLSLKPIKIYIFFICRGIREEEKLQLPLSHAPAGDWPTTQACALTRN